MKEKKLLGMLAVLGLALGQSLVISCASKPPTADISSSANPAEEIAKMDKKIKDAQAANIDVLAQDEYKKSLSSLDEARSDLASNQKQEEILNDIRFSKTYLEQAYAKSQGRAEKAPALFEARQYALRAGAANHEQLRDEWNSVNDDVADDADDLSSLGTDKLTSYQERYVNLERQAVIQTQLSSAQAKVNGARKDGAEKRSPNTLKKAELSLSGAETVIAANVRSPNQFKKSVDTANSDAQLLGEVTETLRANGKTLSEQSALAMVAQKRQISNLKQDLSDSQQDVAGARATIDSRDQAMADQDTAMAERNAQLGSAQATVALQQAIEESRSKFSKDEAEAYQQGNSLLIRLKSVSFASGRSDLPEQSVPLLAKVSQVAKSLNAKEIKVEGHTDSVGTPAANKTLSEARASAVATYLKSNGFDQVPVESEGYGFDKPIATNKSRDGRAQNRRVDIIITPEGATTVNQ